ncbi:MAG TPA: hypothetical protein VNK81_04870 [Thermodesulfobacteriota bacterium]|nr:hypothetical protein [Thermodesulfobacteriota bacterium]
MPFLKKGQLVYSTLSVKGLDVPPPGGVFRTVTLMEPGEAVSWFFR